MKKFQISNCRFQIGKAKEVCKLWEKVTVASAFIADDGGPVG